jgi:cytidyltransferase-like protein
VVISFDDLPRLSDCALVDGAFDPVHAGHVAYLLAAYAKAGRPLICTIASDDDVRAKGRPVCLPAEQRAVVAWALPQVVGVYIKDRPLSEIIEQLKPACYIKGKDWEGKLPADQVGACARHGIPIYYVESSVTDSSTARLSAWALTDADRHLDALEAYMAAQAVTPAERYDREYFEGTWRTTAPAYTLEGRRIAEGKHPEIIAGLWPGHSVLDVGCGPGFLVKFLFDLGVDVWGLEPSAEAIALAPKTVAHRIAQGDTAHRRPREDVVICREVLEHLTVQQAAALVADLFRLARKAVYITTRFHPAPRSVFDVTDERDVDPTHQTLMTQTFLRALCVLNGGRRNRAAEAALDWQRKGRVLVYDVH